MAIMSAPAEPNTSSQAALDLTEKQYAELTDLLARYLPNTQVWAFGSRVSFTPRPTSDIDLAVFATPQQQTALDELRDALDDSNLPFAVDLLNWHQLPESFQANIAKRYIEIQAKELP